MRALILGMDGYIGWALTCSLKKDGHIVHGVDNLLRRRLVSLEGSASAIEIKELPDRVDEINRMYLGINEVTYEQYDITEDYESLCNTIRQFNPDVIFHLAQMPSAPYSMRSRENCRWTMAHNIGGTLNILYAMNENCPSAHLVKIGTMGEYGTPNIPIPEGKCEVVVRGKTNMMHFPRAAASWYHQTKVHDTHNIRMACSQWGLKCTDIMQGIVYGNCVEGMRDCRRSDSLKLRTRMDFDQCFGTVIHRFIVQACIGMPLTVYGNGGQVRSILPLQDSVNCLTLAASNPPEQGESREINQFHEYRSIRDLAYVVSVAVHELTGNTVHIQNIDNPRKEKEGHFYQPIMKVLPSWGYKNAERIEKVVRCLTIDVMDNADMLKQLKSAIYPTVRWSGDVGQINENERQMK